MKKMGSEKDDGLRLSLSLGFAATTRPSFKSNLMSMPSHHHNMQMHQRKTSWKELFHPSSTFFNVLFLILFVNTLSSDP